MFQFGIRSILTVTVAAAALFGLVFALPPDIGGEVLRFCNRLFVPVLVAGVVYGQRYGRAFSIGALAWLAFPLIHQDDPMRAFNMTWNLTPGMPVDAFDRSAPLMRMLITGVAGLLAVGIRFACLPPEPTLPVGSPTTAPVDAPRDRLPYWLIPLGAFLLLVAAMVVWVKVEAGFTRNWQTVPSQPPIYRMVPW